MSIEDPTVISRSWGEPAVWVVSVRALEAHGGDEDWIEQQPRYATLAALGAAWPDLHRRVPLPRLASALAALSGRKAEFGTTLRDHIAELAHDGDGAYRVRRLDHKLHAPAVETLQPPSLAGDRLVVHELAEADEQWTDARHVTVRGFRVTYHLAPTGWTASAEPLPQTTLILDQAAAELAQRFGGAVAGFWRVPLGAGALLVAHGRQPAAAPFVWDAGGSETRFASWAALAAAHPAAARPEALATLAAALLRDLAEGGLTPVADPQAWRPTWEATQRDVVGQHYDAGRRWKTVTRHTLSAPERLVPPAVSADGVLTLVATSAAHQPKGVALPLHDLRLGAPPTVEALTTSQVIADEKEGPPRAPGPPPPPPPPPPPR